MAVNFHLIFFDRCNRKVYCLFFFTLLCFLHNFLRLSLLDKKRRRNTFHFAIMKRLYAANIMCLPITKTKNGQKSAVCVATKQISYGHWTIQSIRRASQIDQKLGCRCVDNVNEDWIGWCSCMYHEYRISILACRLLCCCQVFNELFK